MDLLDKVLNGTKKTVNSLCALYANYGFNQYKMSKFEEYDLYVKNKDFLLSENIITFTDTDGKLMALKPDVTLSIIKNCKEETKPTKLYYEETVYRVSKGTNSFKEFMQVGLECLGDINTYQASEVLMLAVKSLEVISPNYVLDISDLDIVKGVLDGANLSTDARKEVLLYLGEKNEQGIQSVCQRYGVDKDNASVLTALVSLYGKPQTVIEKLKNYPLSNTSLKALTELETIINTLKEFGIEDKINLDFSVINDMSYYSGVVFRGFISGIPTGILSGGQYDKLMSKMGKKQGAIGFAVYLDELSKLFTKTEEYDVETLVVYGDCGSERVAKTVKDIAQSGSSVMAVKELTQKIKYKNLITLKEER